MPITSHGLNMNPEGGEWVQLMGYRELLKTLAAFDEDAPKVARRAIREAAKKVKVDATSRASTFARSGQFRASIGLSDTVRGVKIKTTDPAGGVLEYAHHGAISLSGKRVGTPPGAPNKAITKAVETNETYVLETVDRALGEAIARVRGA